jgi:hypothetical protein
LIKIIAILVSLGLYGALCYHLGGLAPKLAAEKTVAAQASAVAAQDAKQLITSQRAEDKRDAELASLPPPSTHPVYIVRNAACPSVVHVPTETAAADTSSRPTDPGSGSDRGSNVRPAINTFERKYEQALADCREILDKWPISP